MKYGVPVYVNQPVIFYHEVKVDDWREGVMRRPKDERSTTFRYPNEVGSYRRTFSVPSLWKGRDIEGKTYQEIADILKLSETQVKVYLHRARTSIKITFLLLFLYKTS